MCLSLLVCGTLWKRNAPETETSEKKKKKKMWEEKKLSQTCFLESALYETCECLLCYEKVADHKATKSAADSC